MLTVGGTIVDAQGKGLPGVDVAPCWDLYALSPIGGTKTDENGNYSLRAPGVWFDPERAEVFAINAARSHGAVITHLQNSTPLRTPLRPLIKSRFRLDTTYASPESGKTQVWIMRRDGGEVYRSAWAGDRFEAKLPADLYFLHVDGGNVEGFEALTLNPTEREIDFPAVILQPMGGWQSSSVTVTGIVVDSGHKPVADAELACTWELKPMKPRKPWRSDAQGQFTLGLEIESGPGDHEQAILCMDKGRKLGGFLIVGPETGSTPQTIRLLPLVTLRATLDAGTAKPDSKHTKVEIDLHPFHRIASSPWQGPDFVASLPPGKYGLSVLGPTIQHLEKDILLREGVHDLNLGTITLNHLPRSGVGR